MPATPASASPALPRRRPSRVVVEPVGPCVDHGRWPAKASAGAPVVVTADVFADGHEAVAAALRARRIGGTWRETPMWPRGNDRWSATFEPDELGRWEFEVVGWLDHFATWRQGFRAKWHAAEAARAADHLPDGPPPAADAHHDPQLAVDARIGARLLREMAAKAAGDDRSLVSAMADRLDTGADDGLDAGTVDGLDDPALLDAAWRLQPRSPLARSPRRDTVRVERERARVGAWYEFFPRSPAAPTAADHGAHDGDRGNDADEGADGDARPAHATLQDAIERLDRIASMGFDVVYLPPVHPIATTNRKGPNNRLDAEPGDPGSPWAIGAAAGGHTAVHPDLGDLDDLLAFADACRDRGLELAMDIAFQCAPDHPWVSEHPAWFRHRPDGTIQYAENPPKRYQDIYPLDFDTADWEGLWRGLYDVFAFWLERGVEIFRVDNPHTKALAFWEWVLPALHERWPRAVFLAEAFTRPRLMQRLAKAGFSQSYTYFTWRQSSEELGRYVEELAAETNDFLRPNFWPNTPDILTEQLQYGGRPAFVSRAVLAATLTPNWGIYGPAFELVEHTAVRPGSEEYLDSEKYQIRQWDLDRPESLEPLLTHLNTVRRRLTPLQHFHGLRVHRSDDPNLFVFSKTDPSGLADPVLVVVDLDPHQAHGAMVDVDWAALGLPYEDDYVLTDHLGGQVFRWHGARNYVELQPWGLSAHVCSVRRATATDPAVRPTPAEVSRV